MSDFNEPWRAVEVTATHYLIEETPKRLGATAVVWERDRANRTVACVNALAGVADSAEFVACYSLLIEALVKAMPAVLRDQNDAMFEACTDLIARAQKVGGKP